VGAQGFYAILILHSAFLLCKGIHHGFEEEVSQLKAKATKLCQQIIAAYHF
jgi:hypothetical protein